MAEMTPDEISLWRSWLNYTLVDNQPDFFDRSHHNYFSEIVIRTWSWNEQQILIDMTSSSIETKHKTTGAVFGNGQMWLLVRKSRLLHLNENKDNIQLLTPPELTIHIKDFERIREIT